MPRKSVAELAILKNTARLVRLEDNRPPPPPGLSHAEGQVWRLAVSAMPRGWIKSCDEPLLSAFCRHVIMGDLLSNELRKFDLVWIWEDGGQGKLDKLLQMREREVRAASSLATRLRLSPAARTDPKTAHRRIESQPDSPPPWGSEVQATLDRTE